MKPILESHHLVNVLLQLHYISITLNYMHYMVYVLVQ